MTQNMYKLIRHLSSVGGTKCTEILNPCLKHNPFTQKERVHFNVEAGIMPWLKRARSRLSKGKCGDLSMANESWE
ncbi:unnamed protein product [Allacma fusca]|uniref:Uncharacterized protein n=1 Tax=Allacma fusca TaxID=39272 RepID=A0A8J2JHA2_9HEXA|nr:unnamed protein product [Allacma fusca]